MVFQPEKMFSTSRRIILTVFDTLWAILVCLALKNIFFLIFSKKNLKNLKFIIFSSIVMVKLYKSIVKPFEKIFTIEK